MTALPAFGSVLGSRDGWIAVRDVGTSERDELPPETVVSLYGRVGELATAPVGATVRVLEGGADWTAVVLGPVGANGGAASREIR